MGTMAVMGLRPRKEGKMDTKAIQQHSYEAARKSMTLAVTQASITDTEQAVVRAEAMLGTKANLCELAEQGLAFAKSEMEVAKQTVAVLKAQLSGYKRALREKK